MADRITVRQIKAARALLGWTQSELAARSGLSDPTIKRLESGRSELGVSDRTLLKITTALEGAGIEFVTGDEPGLRLTRV